MPDIIKISHGLTIGDLKFGNARPGVVEAILKPGETMEQALDELDERLTAWHRKRYPHLYQERIDPPLKMEFQGTGGGWTTPVNSQSIPIISRDKEKIEIAIDNAESIEDLKKIKAQYEFLPVSLINQYNKRLQELSSGRPGNFTEGLT